MTPMNIGNNFCATKDTIHRVIHRDPENVKQYPQHIENSFTSASTTTTLFKNGQLLCLTPEAMTCGNSTWGRLEGHGPCLQAFESLSHGNGLNLFIGQKQNQWLLVALGSKTSPDVALSSSKERPWGHSTVLQAPLAPISENRTLGLSGQHVKIRR